MRRRQLSTSTRAAAVAAAVVLGAAACASAAEPVGAPASGSSPHQTATARTTSPTTRAPATGDPTVVVTDAGPVRGSLAGATRRFSKVPYAAPPVGDLRWRNPRRPEPWTDTKDATVEAPLCAQISIDATTPVGSEDCLYLSVYAPAVPAPNAPTMVWFHGGGFTGGGPQLTDPTQLAERYGAVVISPAYRLGPLGFAAADELAAEDANRSTGSYGFADQQRALEWVRDNAAAFGGDPGNVTIFGESAGGWSACLQLVSPPSAGLFQRAISQSGSCMVPLITPQRSRAQSAAMASAVGCERDGRVDIACLRATPVDQILAARPASNVLDLSGGTRWGPTVDGWLLPQQVSDAVRDGNVARVPVIIGWNTDEGRLFNGLTSLTTLAPGRHDAAAYRDGLLAFTANQPDVAARIEAQYPLGKYRDADEAFSAVLGDAALKCPGRDMAVALAKDQPVFVYSFAYRGASFPVPIPDLAPGAFHTAEIQFVFATPLRSNDPVEQQLAGAMAARWVQFASTGGPNGGLLSPAWPAYDGSPSASHLVFDTAVTAGTGLDAEACDFWASLRYEWVQR
ncbi:MAG: carboxylesterase family protein [Actinobacteria bacterium]|nr:carboxylesterase family protein [Actinomycetota bacterium]